MIQSRSTRQTTTSRSRSRGRPGTTTTADRADDTTPPLPPMPGVHPGLHARQLAEARQQLADVETELYRRGVELFADGYEQEHDADVQGFSQDQPLDKVCDIVLDIPVSGKDMRRFLRVADAWVVKQLKKGSSEAHMNKLNPREREQFREAKTVEIKSWLAKKAVAAATEHVPSNRLMQMRWVLTWRNIDDPANPGQRKAKARLVLRGFQDPDLETLPISAPTMTRRTRQLFLQMAAQKRWRLLQADAKTAFLQGGATQPTWA